MTHVASTSLTDYFEAIAESFDTDTNPDGLDPPPISVVFGRKEAYRQDNRGAQGRVAIMYGAPNGDAGGEAPTKYLGTDPRNLKDTLEQFTVYIWAYDLTDDGNEIEEAQYDAVTALYNAWRRYTFLAHEDLVHIESRRWRSPENIERQFGKELEVQCTIRSPVPDEGLELLTGLGAVGTVVENRVSEVIVAAQGL